MLSSKYQCLQRMHSPSSFDASTQQDVGKHSEDEGESLDTIEVTHSALYSPGK